MSLINDALKDLDERSESAMAKVKQASRGNTNPARKPYRVSMLAAFSIGGTLFVAGFLGGDYLPWHPNKSEQISITSPEKSIGFSGLALRSKPDISEPASGIETVSESNAKSNSINHSAEADKHSLDNVIIALLQSGNKALSKDRLTRPTKSSALQYFQKVLSYDAENISALTGIHKIKLRYIELVTRSFDRGEPEQAETLLTRLNSLLNESDHKDLGSHLYRINALVERSRGERTKLAERPLNNKTEQKAGVISPTATQSESDIVSAYDALIKANNFGAAQKTLEAAVNSAKRDQQPVILARLFDHYLDNAKVDEAKVLLIEREALGETWVYQRASILKAESRSREALIYLRQQALDGAMTDEKSLSLYAGLLNKTGDYEESTKAYRQLVAMNSEEPIYWLGLAISEDALDNYEEAYKAYQITLRYGEHSQIVAQFVRHRINKLKTRLGSQLELSQW